MNDCIEGGDFLKNATARFDVRRIIAAKLNPPRAAGGAKTDYRFASVFTQMLIWRGAQVGLREWFAKPSFAGSNPTHASFEIWNYELRI